MFDMDQKLWTMMNNHVTSEYYANRFYMQSAILLDKKSWEDFQKWAEKSAGEEIEHGNKFIEYMNLRGQGAKLQAIPAPPDNLEADPLAILEEAAKLEKKVTNQISELCDLAFSLKDWGTFFFLQWFVEEQEKSEYEIAILVDNLKRAKAPETAVILEVGETLND